MSEEIKSETKNKEQVFDIFNNQRYELHIGKRGGLKVYSLLSKKYMTTQCKVYVCLIKDKGGKAEPYLLKDIEESYKEGIEVAPMSDKAMQLVIDNCDKELQELINCIPCNEDIMSLPVEYDNTRVLEFDTGRIIFNLYKPYKFTNGRVKAYFNAAVIYGKYKTIHKNLPSFDYESEWHIKDIKTMKQEEKEELIKLLSE